MDHKIPTNEDEAREFIRFALYSWVRLTEPDPKPYDDDPDHHNRIVRGWGDKADELILRVMEMLTAERPESVKVERFRTHQNGRQIACVGHYAYLVPEGVELDVGQEVLPPRSWLDDVKGTAPEWCRVTSIGTDYDGALAELQACR